MKYLLDQTIRFHTWYDRLQEPWRLLFALNVFILVGIVLINELSRAHWLFGAVGVAWWALLLISRWYYFAKKGYWNRK